MPAIRTLLGVVLALCPVTALVAASPGNSPENSSGDPSQESADAVDAGHSYHGEAFNEGPRQAAVLMPGMAAIEFPTSTKSELAQLFIEQGIAQLHGFWYLEAERSFRQAANEDPELAIAYWGMAMANVNNSERARGFIDQAKEKSKSNTSKREKLYIDALERYLPKAKDDDESSDKADEKEADKQKEAEREQKTKRGERYIADLEKILYEHPDDLEAKAFLVVQIWMGDREGVKLTSRYAVEALLKEIFAVNPDHPAHHYRIHLWDSARPENALESAAKSGPSSPGIAHMWHMPGHIYSKLKRYGDAAWQQEASARVDHSHMIETRLMPDQIHNFAHNNEWLVRNLNHIGRVSDAIDLAKNLVSLPQHPRYNSIEKRGSHKFGRQRLLQTLTRYALWQQVIDEINGGDLPPTDHKATQRDELGWLGVAQFLTGDKHAGAKTLRQLQRQRIEMQTQLLDDAERVADASDVDQDQTDDETDPVKRVDRKAIQKDIESLRGIIARVAASAATARKDTAALKSRLKDAKLDASMEAIWLAEAGDLDAAIKSAERGVKDGPDQVQPLAVLVDLLWRDKQTETAQKRFSELRKLASQADLDTPLLAKLSEVAKSVDADEDWRIVPPAADDLGARPPLDQLGPFRWQPYQADSWQARTADGQLVQSSELTSRPKLMIFYLGFGCLHCIEQLHEFDPHFEAFRDAGIDIVAISSESADELATGLEDFEKKLNIPLYSDGDQQVFKSYRCWDDFESQPLHGTFLVDGQGRVRWQDISYEPFKDVQFLLKESKRLLQQK
ncbi:peroxiredoxin family protein [Stieleria sp. TO1_6]|uniref:peroxiredoxin family protein n=1 Tax=Stieleria tagensis TaxID=2956795 RepID=UPI00209AD3B6|nr:redoxin domain-containing protein [Stieleria tagensis]MCO8120861.1 peroxiredoxin family protein [Stieleria tagensis]